jgi:hypothetical protein
MAEAVKVALIPRRRVSSGWVTPTATFDETAERVNIARGFTCVDRQAAIRLFEMGSTRPLDYITGPRTNWKRSPFHVNHAAAVAISWRSMPGILR